MAKKIQLIGMITIIFVFTFSQVFAAEVQLEETHIGTETSVLTSEESEVSLPASIETKEGEYFDKETNHTLLILDDANLLSDTEKDLLMSDMMPLLRYGNVVFLSVDQNESTADALARNTYHDKFQSTSGVLFLIDMDNREIILFSDGEVEKQVTADKEDSITDNAYRYASNGDYYTCASSVFQQVDKVLKGQKISEPMKYISNALIALTLGFFISFLFVWKHSDIKRASSQEIVKNCAVAFSVGAITATKIGQHRVYSPPSSSSSSGYHSSGGGGGFSGGHSSGSSGGHRF